VSRPPAPLGALLAVSALLAVAWACVLPAFQAPDEQSHFAYVQSLAERHALPGVADRPFFSTQMTQGIDALNSDQVAAQLEVKPEWSDQVEGDWRAGEGAGHADDGGGPGPASDYPPTAYAWQALGYAAAGGGTLWDELLGARLMSALWVPLTVLATWLLAGEVFGRRRLLQTAAAAVPALLPMFTFISASVSPDGMMYGLWALALWLGVRCVKRGVPARDAIAFFALVGLACTVKTASYALLVPAAFVAVVGLAARRPWRIGGVLKLAAAVALPLALTLGVWVFAARVEDRPAAAQVAAATASSSGTNWRELLSYLWQYYLPKTPLQTEYRVPPGGYPLLQVWITQAWGAFGWLEVKFAPMVYRVLAILTVGVFGAALGALWRARRDVDRRVLAFLALAFFALLGGLHWTDYHQLEAGALGFMQGRYMFPVIAIFGLALAGAVSLLPVGRRAAATGAAVAGLLVFHILALGLVVSRFYA
jgi:4-amino-4-deoxy-L-arabinose transferase-like glycosyltransferase